MHECAAFPSFLSVRGGEVHVNGWRTAQRSFMSVPKDCRCRCRNCVWRNITTTHVELRTVQFRQQTQVSRCTFTGRKSRANPWGGNSAHFEVNGPFFTSGIFWLNGRNLPKIIRMIENGARFKLSLKNFRSDDGRRRYERFSVKKVNGLSPCVKFLEIKLFRKSEWMNGARFEIKQNERWMWTSFYVENESERTEKARKRSEIKWAVQKFEITGSKWQNERSKKSR